MTADVVGFLAALDRADLEVDLRGIARDIRLVGDVPDRPRLRARPEQCSLRTGQRLDPLDVDRADIDLLRDRRERLIVEIYRHLAVGVVLGRTRRDAAHEDRVAARLVVDEVHARQRADYVLGVLQRLPLDVGGREGGDALPDLLEVQLAPRRGHDDGFELPGVRCWPCWPRERDGYSVARMAAVSGLEL